jgi:hypothetical protein
MSVLWNKNSQRLENIRFYTRTDKIFYSVDNRPLWDLEQRDKDIDRIFTPARGLRVRETATTSTSFQVEEGWYLAGGVTQTLYPTTTVGPVPATSAPGQKRIDLVWFNIQSGSVVRTMGTEAVAYSATVGAAGGPPAVPGNSGAVPLAHLYVDNTPTAFSEQVVTAAAGRILDVRPAPGTSAALFETAAGNLVKDTTGGNIGALYTHPRADHAHPLNANATVPAVLSVNTAGIPGVGTLYPLVDHVHTVTVEGNVARLQQDGSASVGILGEAVRSDHIHPLNADAVVPSDISRTTPLTGAAVVYSLRDHVHKLPTNLAYALGLLYARSAVNTITIAAGGSASCGMTAVISIAANTVSNGIMVVATAEAVCHATIGAAAVGVLEYVATQGATTKRFASSPTASTHVIAGSGLANLGGVPLTWNSWSDTHSNYNQTTATAIGVWAKAGCPILGSLGGLDFDPTQITTIDFGSAFCTADMNEFKIGNRSIAVIGF